jgi:uncharacterized protein DUF4136
MKPSIILAAAVLVLSTSAVFGQKVTVDVDATANFSTFKTFGWAEGMVARNPIVSQMIIAAVESELTARGLTKSADNPDIKVAVGAAVGMDIQTVGPSWNLNYVTWGGYTNPAAVMNIPIGTLLVDLVDTKKDIGVLRGVAKETLTRSPSADKTADAKSVDKLIKKAVSKIFKKYPVAPRKS